MNSIKQYTNSKGESLPKVICAVVDFEIQKQNIQNTSIGPLFKWHESEIFGKDKNANKDSWARIFNADYDCFYSIFPTCKNSRGQELPEEIQVEIVEERLRQGLDKPHLFLGFIFRDALKGSDYWLNIWESDYTNTELPTKSDDTFTQGKIVEMSNYKEFAPCVQMEYVSFYKDIYVGYHEGRKTIDFAKYCRKIQPLELTLPELLTIAEEVKGTKVILKS